MKSTSYLLPLLVALGWTTHRTTSKEDSTTGHLRSSRGSENSSAPTISGRRAEEHHVLMRLSTMFQQTQSSDLMTPPPTSSSSSFQSGAPTPAKAETVPSAPPTKNISLGNAADQNLTLAPRTLNLPNETEDLLRFDTNLSYAMDAPPEDELIKPEALASSFDWNLTNQETTTGPSSFLSNFTIKSSAVPQDLSVAPQALMGSSLSTQSPSSISGDMPSFLASSVENNITASPSPMPFEQTNTSSPANVALLLNQLPGNLTTNRSVSPSMSPSAISILEALAPTDTPTSGNESLPVDAGCVTQNQKCDFYTEFGSISSQSEKEALCHHVTVGEYGGLSSLLCPANADECLKLLDNDSSSSSSSPCNTGCTQFTRLCNNNCKDPVRMIPGVPTAASQEPSQPPSSEPTPINPEASSLSPVTTLPSASPSSISSAASSTSAPSSISSTGTPVRETNPTASPWGEEENMCDCVTGLPVDMFTSNDLPIMQEILDSNFRNGTIRGIVRHDAGNNRRHHHRQLLCDCGTVAPSTSSFPSTSPSSSPTSSHQPSQSPSMSPTLSAAPSHIPTNAPSRTQSPSDHPSGAPSRSFNPSVAPTTIPSVSSEPSITQSAQPSSTHQPSNTPSSMPSLSMLPTRGPSHSPSRSKSPSNAPSTSPSVSLSPSIPPTTSMSPTNHCSDMNPEDRESQIRAILSTVSDEKMFDNGASPQGRAYDWMIHEDPMRTCPSSAFDCHIIQRFALATLYFSTGGDEWTNCNAELDQTTCPENQPRATRVNDDWGCDAFSTRWLADSHECDWCGNRCNADQCMTEIQVEVNHMTGKLPEELTVMTNLTSIRLEQGNVTGTIPNGMSALEELLVLDLDFQDLTGSIPNDIYTLKNLIQLDLNNNEFTGTIATEVGNLSNLVFLQLQNNRLEGTLPRELAQLTNLFTGEFFGNDFLGSMPEEVCDLGWGGSVVNGNGGGIDIDSLTNSTTHLSADCLAEDSPLECDCCTICY